MNIGFAAFEFVAHATRQRFYSSGRPVADTSGRPVQFFTHHPQPVDFDADDPLGWLIPRCREMGFDAVEASLRQYLDPGELDRIGDLLDQHSIRLATDYGYDFSKPPKPQEEFREYARAAKRLGVTAIGAGGMPFSINRFVDDPPFAEQMEMMVSGLRPMVEVAEDEGLKLALENHADYRCGELLEHVIEPIGSPALGIKLDTGNCPLVIEDPVEAARISAPVCHATHFKDMQVMPVTPEGGKIVGAPIGRGSCRLDEVGRILAGSAPDPADLIFSIEVGWMPPNEDYFQWLHESAKWCRKEFEEYLEPLS